MSKKITTILLATTALIATITTVIALFYNKSYKHTYCNPNYYYPNNNSF